MVVVITKDGMEKRQGVFAVPDSQRAIGLNPANSLSSAWFGASGPVSGSW